jgi:hypothetical protein
MNIIILDDGFDDFLLRQFPGMIAHGNLIAAKRDSMESLKELLAEQDRSPKKIIDEFLELTFNAPPLPEIQECQQPHIFDQKQNYINGKRLPRRNKTRR